MRFRVVLPAIILLGLSLFSLFTGVAKLNWSNLFADPQSLLVLINSRFPRTLAVILVGVSLAVAGLIMQIIVHNRFVEPSVAGTSQGASLGLLLVMLFYPELPVLAKMAVASLSAFLAMGGFLILAQRIPAHDPLLLPLMGIVYGGVLGAVATFLAYQNELIQLLRTMLSGDFSAIIKGRYELLWANGLAVIIAYLLADQLTIIGMGKQSAQALGVNYRQLTIITMAVVSMVTALVVITVGMISFLGLVMPNIVRQFTGDNLRRCLPWTAWSGACLLLICDILARLLRFPYEIPVSTIVGVLGAFLFLYLLLKNNVK